MKRNKHKPKAEPPANVAPGAVLETAPVAPPRRRWLSRLVALMLVPLALCGLELGLRLGGYGYPTSFFKRQQIGAEEFLVENDKFGLRFFPPDLVRSPAPVRMAVRKPPGTRRIFLFGESAALGDPRPAFGPGRYLQALLRERYPGTKWEVVCVAMTAINSHAVLPIARECAQWQGDAWIVYLGNNEMVGPFGATPVFGFQAPPRWLVRLSLSAQQTRLGQLAAEVGHKLRRRPADAANWGGMEMFTSNRVAPHDPAKETIYRNFRANLEEILRAGVASAVPVLLSGVAVNLKDCPPFASLAGANVPALDRAACDQFLLEGLAAEKQTNLPSAAACFAQAAALDPSRAEVQYRLAEYLVRLTNAAAARSCYQGACDRDALPFRADSWINRSIAEAGQQYAGRGVAWLDAAAALATNNAAGVPGAESFYEHVHLNFDGNYRLARLWADHLDRMLPASVGGAAGEWISQETCERRLGLTDWNRAAVMQDMIRRLQQPPFSGQSNQERRLAELRRQFEELRGRADTNAVAGARRLYAEALERAPGDHRLHENLAEFLEITGDLPGATAEWDRVRELIPYHHVGHFQAGRLLLRQGKLPEARRRLLHAVTLRPDLSEGWLQLGQIHAMEGKPALALPEYERAQRLVPRDPRTYYHIGKALSNMSRKSEAVAELKRAVQLRDGYWEARYALGEELAFAGRLKDARDQFAEVVRLKPDYPMAHFNLGVALAVEGKIEEAIRQFEETVRLDSRNQAAADYLEKLRKLNLQPKSGSRN